MKINYIWEHNNNDTLIYFPDYIGAFVRGENKNAALKKANKEAAACGRRTLQGRQCAVWL